MFAMTMSLSRSDQINFPSRVGGWFGGWVDGLLGNKNNSVSPAEVERKLS